MLLAAQVVLVAPTAILAVSVWDNMICLSSAPMETDSAMVQECVPPRDALRVTTVHSK